MKSSYRKTGTVRHPNENTWIGVEIKSYIFGTFLHCGTKNDSPEIYASLSWNLKGPLYLLLVFHSCHCIVSILGFGIVSPRKPLYKPKPPDSRSLKVAREQRLKEIQMWSIIREILFYAFFLWILMVISYRSVSTYSFSYKDTMKNVFIRTNDTKKAFSKVKQLTVCHHSFNDTPNVMQSFYDACLLRIIIGRNACLIIHYCVICVRIYLSTTMLNINIGKNFREWNVHSFYCTYVRFWVRGNYKLEFMFRLC